MFKHKIFNLAIFTSLVFILFFVSSSVAKATSTDGTLPDNVKITSSPDGSSTTVIINSKLGYKTNVAVSCVNGKCTNNASSTVITNGDVDKMKENMKKQQEAMENFWKIQDELFRQQQEMFQNLWGINWF